MKATPRAVAVLLVGTADALSIQASPRRAAWRCASPCATEPSLPLLADDIWDAARPVRVEGNTLRTWALGAESAERLQLSIRSSGRPVHAEVELWQTPSYVPSKCKVWLEDGAATPFHALIEMPRQPETVAVFNKVTSERDGVLDAASDDSFAASMTYPFEVSVLADGSGRTASDALSGATPELVQGGKVTSFAFGAEVQSVQLQLQTEQRDMKAFVEVLQNPDDQNQIFEIEATEPSTPFYAFVTLAGGANVIRIINQNTVEFPLYVSLLPYETTPAEAVVMDGPSW